MNIINTGFKDLQVLETNILEDNRGSFQKIFNYDFFHEFKLDSDFKEFYYSKSKKNTIRGMHFQSAPVAHTKLVYVSNGSITDVVVDLRKKSKTFGKVFSVKLDSQNGKALYIPKGFAHGFLALEDNTIVNYAQTSCYSKENDYGILFHSIGFDWNIDKPIISDRDLTFPELALYIERSLF